MRSLLFSLTVLMVGTSSLSAQWMTDTLSEARRLIGVGSAQGQIIFAGGKKENNLDSRAIDIYDAGTDTWRTARSPFGIGNTGMAAVSGENHVMYYQRGSSIRRFGVFDVLRDTIYSVDFDNSRSRISPVIADNKIFLAGGRFGFSQGGGNTDRVDIYDLETNTWSLTTLPQARNSITTVNVGGKVFFLGGEININTSDFSSEVDVYDLATGAFISNGGLSLGEARSSIGIVVDTLNQKIYAAGGRRGNSSGAFGASSVIDFIDANALTSVQLELPTSNRSQTGELLNEEVIFVGGIDPRAVTISLLDTSIQTVDVGAPGSGVLAGVQSASHNGKAYFVNTFGAAGQFVYIYDEASRSFSTFDTGAQRDGNSIGKVGNTVFVAAGATDEIVDSRLVFSITGPPVSVGRQVPRQGPAITVMPNPTSGPLTVDLTEWPREPLQVRMFNALGGVVREFTTTSTSTVTMEIGDLPAQLYFLTVSQGARQRTVRVLKR